MDDHFSRILAPSSGPSSSSSTSSSRPPSESDSSHLVQLIRFIASDVFAGKKTGYYFTKGSKGTGYYYDPKQKEALFGAQESASNSSSSSNKKRKTEHESEYLSSSSSSSSSSVDHSIERLLEESEDSLQQITPLDAVSLKSLITNLDKKVKKNQMLRMKHVDDAKKFMDSELELYEHLQELYGVAAYPELYNVFIENDALVLVIDLLSHENTDISVSVIGLLQEMLDSESMEGLEGEMQDYYQDLVRAIMRQQGYEILIQNLTRLDSSSEEGSQGVFNTLSTIESSISIIPELSTVLCKHTALFRFLVNRLRVKGEFDQNKLYCSEILSMLLQASTENNRIFMQEDSEEGTSSALSILSGGGSGVGGVDDGLDSLLRVVDSYRKKDPKGADELELLDNAFLCIRSLLQNSQTCQAKFIELEGFDLMLKCIKERVHAGGRALKVLVDAVKSNATACETLVDAGGLKYIFPMFMGRALPLDIEKKKSSHPDRIELEECCISIIAQLCAKFSPKVVKDGASCNSEFLLRLQSKLCENENEKLDRCIELFVKYANKLAIVDRDTENLHREYERTQNADILGLIDEDVVQIRRLENGLESLIHLSIVLSSVGSLRPESLQRISLKLEADKYSIGSIVEVLHAYIEDLDLDDEGATEEERLYSNTLISLHDNLIDLLPDADDI